MLHHRLAQFTGQRLEPAPIVRRRYPDRSFGQLRVGQPVWVQPAPVDQRMHQGITVAGLHTGYITDLIAVVPQSIQQRQHTGRRVQADGVADPRVLGGIGREHQCHPLVGGFDSAQCGVVDRQAGDPGTPFRVGHIGDQALGVNLLERERDSDDAAVKLRHRHLGGHIAGAQAIVAGSPGSPRTRQTQSLQDRDIQGSKVFNVPAVVVSPGCHHRGHRRAGGKHGDHHRIDPAQQLQKFGFRCAQRGAVHRQWPCAGAFDRTAQRLDVSSVAGQLLGAVVEHSDGGGIGGHRGPRGFHPGEAGRAARAARATRCRRADPVEHTPGRGVGRRGEAEAGHQQGVADEGVQLA